MTLKYNRIPYDIDKIMVPVGEVHIEKDRCKGCGFCIEYCPKNVLEFSEEFNAHGYHPPQVTYPGRCLNCGLCELLCPEFAIWNTLKGEREAKIEG
jgi:2-oxoglutarate ferredoxin oxidoreductase subunit delta